MFSTLTQKKLVCFVIIMLLTHCVVLLKTIFLLSIFFLKEITGFVRQSVSFNS